MLFVCAPEREMLFAAITATLDRLGFNIVSARLLVTADGRVFDTFDLLDAEAGADSDSARAAFLQAELARVLDARELRARVARRGLPRRLRHFQRAPKVEFADRDGATQLALVCSDRPGLLAEVAQVFHEARVRVHDARIATFGERVEDFFVLTDASGAVLGESDRRVLQAALHERLGSAAPRTSE